MPFALGMILAVLASIAYGTGIYWDVSRLIQDEVARVKMQRSTLAPLIRVGGTLCGHVLVVVGYGLALGSTSTGVLVMAAIILFFPTALVLSSFMIKTLGKGTIFLSAGVNCVIMVFLKLWGVL